MPIDSEYAPKKCVSPTSVAEILSSLEYAKKSFLKCALEHHSISFPSNATCEVMRSLLSLHISSGCCLGCSADACRAVVAGLIHEDCTLIDQLQFQILIISSSIKKLSSRSLHRMFDNHKIYYEADFSLSKFQRELRKFITRLQIGKSNEEKRTAIIEAEKNAELKRQELHKNWPQIVPKTLKDKVSHIFKQQTSSSALSTFTCAVCSSETYCADKQERLLSELDMEILKIPPSIDNLPHPYVDGPLKNTLVDPKGISSDKNGNLLALLCKTCQSALNHDKKPPLSLVNGTYLGPVPSELHDLTPIEEAMIARCRSKCWVIQLKEENSKSSMPDTQRGFHGHIIIYPQKPSEISQLLPPPIDDIITPICVLFIGSTPPTTKWLQEKAKPLCVQREKVRAALLWLKKNNPLYSDIIINEGVLDSLQEEQILPFHIQQVIPSEAAETLTDHYDNRCSGHEESIKSNTATENITFQNVVITDIDGLSPVHELCAAALRHIKCGGGYIQIPHDPTPINEFFNPELFPMIYPTLFPYGKGGFEDKTRQVPISMKRHVKYLCGLSDRRFQEHYSFLFTAFNILQRRSILLHTSLKVKKTNFNSIAASFASISPETVHIVTERVSQGDSVTANNNEERKVLKLMKEINIVTGNVPGSSSSRVIMRNEIRALMIEKGMPSFFITINPADVYNPLVKFLGGADIDIDALLPQQVPNY